MYISIMKSKHSLTSYFTVIFRIILASLYTDKKLKKTEAYVDKARLLFIVCLRIEHLVWFPIKGKLSESIEEDELFCNWSDSQRNWG